MLRFRVELTSLSLGTPNPQHYNCQANRELPPCLTIAYAASRDAPLIAASGNQRVDLNFPASDTRVISAGGFNANPAFWDDFPNCPASPNGSECGSNYSKLTSGHYFTHQELIGSAKQVLSTFYPNKTWVDYAECGDSYGGPIGDGIGWCTGTSMSAPQIAGAVGLLRSINPLVSTSEPEPTVGTNPGLRTVLAQTASHSLAWDPQVGYGIPDVAAAAKRVLGIVDGAIVRNRATPLFRLYNSYAKDFADTTSPQYALSLLIAQAHKYVQPSTGLGTESTVPGYTFPYDLTNEAAPAAPRAAIYVLTTEYRPRDNWPALIPLYLMDKPKANGTDYMLVTTPAEIQTAYNGGTNGYNLRTIQGYIYQACNPDCAPPGAEILWREYNATNNDCAVFLESERTGVNGFETNGYTAACPAGATKKLGYAYPATDSDGDGLPDGFEYVVGTNPLNPGGADSDGDGKPDAIEFPMVGLPTDDPCQGGTLGASKCGADVLFKNGFENP